MTFNEEIGYYMTNHENGYAIISHETGEQVYFHESFRKAQTKMNKLNKRCK